MVPRCETVRASASPILTVSGHGCTGQGPSAQPVSEVEGIGSARKRACCAGSKQVSLSVCAVMRSVRHQRRSLVSLDKEAV